MSTHKTLGRITRHLLGLALLLLPLSLFAQGCERATPEVAPAIHIEVTITFLPADDDEEPAEDSDSSQDSDDESSQDEAED